MAFVEHDDEIEAVAANRTDDALGERILPGAVRRGEDFVNAHTLHAVPKVLAVDLITVAQEIGWRGVVRERVHDLLGSPSGGRVFCDVEVNDTPAVVGEHNEDEEDVQADGGDGGDGEDIDGDQIAAMVGEERAPGLRRLGGRLGIKRDTVRSATSIPILRSSPWMRGAPQSGFAVPCG